MSGSFSLHPGRAPCAPPSTPRIGASMAVSRYCPHGNLRATCPQCRLEALDEANQRAAANRARGESGPLGRIEGAELPYPWQRESFQAWLDGGRSGLVALSLGLPTGDLPFSGMAAVVNAS